MSAKVGTNSVDAESGAAAGIILRTWLVPRGRCPSWKGALVEASPNPVNTFPSPVAVASTLAETDPNLAEAYPTIVKTGQFRPEFGHSKSPKSLDLAERTQPEFGRDQPESVETRPTLITTRCGGDLLK